MDDAKPRAETEPRRGDWTDLLSGGRGLYSALVVGGVALHGTQILVIAIIMPTIVADIGGAAFYTWGAMLYTIGAIIGSSSTGLIWSRFGARRGYTLAAGAFALGTLLCALAPNMAALIVARGVQGWAGGLVHGGGTALITGLFDASLRTRILAVSQGTFTLCHLAGPVVGGAFAAIGWWRGSFLVMLPFLALFAALAWLRIPDRMATEAERNRRPPPMPWLRLTTLAVGVCCIAATGPVGGMLAKLALVVCAVALVTLALWLDGQAAYKLFPARALSLDSAIGLALAILALNAMVHTAVFLFLPLLLQVVHGVSPVIINFVTIVISIGWSVGSFAVSGWTGQRERWALLSGPVMSLAGLVVMSAVATAPGLVLFTAGAFVMGVGIGAYSVHLLARAMEGAARGEQASTSAALATARAIGTAFGAAIAGVIAHAAGLGAADEAAAVGPAVSAVFWACALPTLAASMLMVRFVRTSQPAGVPT